MIDNRTVLWYNTGIKRWFSVQYRLGTAHQKTPIVIHDYRGFLIIRRSDTACEARTGSHFASLPDGSLLTVGASKNIREAKFPCSFMTIGVF